MHTPAREPHRTRARRRWRPLAILLVVALAAVGLAARTARALEGEGTSRQEVADARSYLTEHLDPSVVSPDAEPPARQEGPLARLLALFPHPAADAQIADTGRALRVKYTLVDGRVPDTLTIDQLWDDEDHYGAAVFIAQYVGITPIFDVGDDDYLVANVDATALNGAAGRVLDQAFAHTNDNGQSVEGVRFDEEAGLCYLPRTLVEDADEDDLIPLQAQLLVAQPVGEAPCADIRLTAHSSRWGVDVAAEETVVSATGFDGELTVPLVATDDAGKVGLEDLAVRVNGFDAPLDLDKQCASYDRTTGELTLALPPIGVSEIDVSVGGNPLASAAKRLVAPRQAYAVSAANMNFYDHGSLTLFEGLEKAYRENRVITYDGMVYSTGYATNSDELAALRERTNAEKMVYYYPGTHDATEGGLSLKDAEGVFDHTDSQWYWRCISLPGDEHASGYSVGTAAQWAGLLGVNGSKRSVVLPVACAHITRDVVTGGQHKTKIRMRVLDIDTTAQKPFVVIAFCTASTLDDGNASQVGTGIIKFHLKTTGKLTLRKASTLPDMTADNGSYSLKGATYEVRAADGRKVGSLVTDASGAATESLSLPAGRYTVVETGAPTGYQLDTTTHHVEVVAGETTHVKTTDVPLYDTPSLAVEKLDRESGRRVAQGDASLAGAEFTVRLWSNTAGTTTGPALRSWVLRTNEDGKAYFTDDCLVSGDDFYRRSDGTPILPLGTVSVEETKAPEGYLLDDSGPHVQVISSKGGTLARRYATVKQSEQVVRGGVAIGKIASELGGPLPQGEGSLEGATFSITLQSPRPVRVGGTEYACGQTVMSIATVREGERYVARTGPQDLPYGTYELRETAVSPASGYLPNTAWSRTFEIRSDGSFVDLTSDEDACPNAVQREDVSFTKRNAETAAAMGLVPFLLTSDTTGEAHVIVTDENGLFDTTLVPHSQATNANDAALGSDGTVDEALLSADAGVWFSGRADATVAPDDRRGALPFDTYTLQELRCAANEGTHLVRVTLGMHRNGYALDWGTIDDRMGPRIGTELTAANGAHEAPATASAKLTDTVFYDDLSTGATYTLVSTLHLRAPDGTDAGPLSGDAGQPVRTSTTFKARGGSGVVEVALELPEADLAGQTLVCYEELFEGSSGGGTPIASHADISDEDQAVRLVGLATSAADGAGGAELSWDHEATIVDTISYRGLTPGTTYTVLGSVHVRGADGTDLGPATDATGTAVTASATVVPERADGTFELAFPFDATAQAGNTLVVFERLLDADGTLVGSHEDIDDEDQTVRVIGIKTQAQDNETQAHVALREGMRTITDTVSCHNLTPGTEYVLAGTLHTRDEDGTDAGELRDAAGTAVSARTTFMAEKSDATVELTFTFDAGLLATPTVVAFERLWQGERLVGAHEDIADEDQGVTYPHVATSLADADTQTQLIEAAADATLVDAVSFRGLSRDQTYTVSGTLHLRDAQGGDAGVLKDPEGAPVTSHVSFRPEAADGTVRIPFSFDARDLAGRTVVAFEQLALDGTGTEQDGTIIARHEDIGDERQSVRVAGLATTLTDRADGDHTVSGGMVELTDTVAYQGLLPHETYQLTGELHLRSKGGADAGVLRDASGAPVVAHTKFTASQPSGVATVTFSCDVSRAAGRDIVCFEELTLNGTRVATHADITDKAQTVTITRPTTPKRTSTSARSQDAPHERMPQTGRLSWAMPLLVAGGLSIALALAIFATQRRRPDESRRLRSQTPPPPRTPKSRPRL